MSAYPLMLDGASLRALVVGGGTVGLRKTRALLDAGASVRVVAPQLDDAFVRLDSPGLAIERREYSADDIGDAMLIIAATSSRAVNAVIARDARARGRLVNVVDRSSEGNCTTPAVHRAGDLVIAITAGGVPAAAARVRDAIAAHYGDRYRDAVRRLADVRAELLASRRRETWIALSADVVGPDFCETVETGELDDRLMAWR